LTEAEVEGVEQGRPPWLPPPPIPPREVCCSQVRMGGGGPRWARSGLSVGAWTGREVAKKQRGYE